MESDLVIIYYNYIFPNKGEKNTHIHMGSNHQFAKELMKLQGYEFMIGVRRWVLLVSMK